ncbi:MAG: DNA photolyase family protein [Caldilinea sp.]|nr:DNA photolyase family protein [Caldilinea sp.]
MITAAIWWVRRDLRLVDNQALTAALYQGGAVLPVFVVDPALLNSPYVGERRTAFLFGGLRALATALAERGGRLIVRHGDPATVLAALCHESGANAVYAESDVSPYATARDRRVAAALPVPLHLTGGLTIREPAATLKDDGTPYTVYTPYSRRWRSHPPVRRSDILAAARALETPAAIASDALLEATAPESAVFMPGEEEAKRRLRAFVAGPQAPIHGYANSRNRPDLEGTSQLSPYLRFGMISARMAALAAYEAGDNATTREAREGADTWLAELIWRDFYISILHHFPHVRRGSFRPEYDAIAWANDEAHFTAWCTGQTGYPIVDAAMRQLAATGWMHNRSRMIVASFLVKDLLIDWRWGERWFMQQLLDGDPAANNGGWQWTAGTGTDAAPYFRVFNPVSQGQKFDPDGAYIRRWVPELQRVPDKFIHAPWTMPRSDQVRAGCHIGAEYPAPLVDHAAARERVLAAYKAVKS